MVGKIAVLIPNDTPFWLRVNGLAKKAGEDLGVDVSIFKYVSFDGKITETVQQAISEGAQGIIIPNFHNGNIGIG